MSKYMILCSQPLKKSTHKIPDQFIPVFYDFSEAKEYRDRKLSKKWPIIELREDQ
jgi:hypothetical protein